MKTQSRNNLTKWKKDKRIEEKGYASTGKAKVGIFPIILEDWSCQQKDGVYEFWWNRNHASKGGTPQTRVTIDGFWEDPRT